MQLDMHKRWMMQVVNVWYHCGCTREEWYSYKCTKEECCKLWMYIVVVDVQEENVKEQVVEGICKAQVCSYKGISGRCVNWASSSCKVWILLRQDWCSLKGPLSKEGVMVDGRRCSGGSSD